MTEQTEEPAELTREDAQRAVLEAGKKFQRALIASHTSPNPRGGMAFNVSVPHLVVQSELNRLTIEAMMRHLCQHYGVDEVLLTVDIAARLAEETKKLEEKKPLILRPA